MGRERAGDVSPSENGGTRHTGSPLLPLLVGYDERKSWRKTHDTPKGPTVITKAPIK